MGVDNKSIQSEYTLPLLSDGTLQLLSDDTLQLLSDVNGTPSIPARHSCVGMYLGSWKSRPGTTVSACVSLRLCVPQAMYLSGYMSLSLSGALLYLGRVL